MSVGALSGEGETVSLEEVMGVGVALGWVSSVEALFDWREVVPSVVVVGLNWLVEKGVVGVDVVG